MKRPVPFTGSGRRVLAAWVGVLLLAGCGGQNATSTTSSEPASATGDYAAVVDELVNLAGDGQPLLFVADFASTILYDNGFPGAGAWWSRLGFILGEGLDRERYQFRTPVTIQHAAADGSMEICIGDECHEMTLVGDEDRQAAVDGAKVEQLVAEAPEGFLVHGWCSPDTMFAFGQMPDQSSLPIPGQSNLSVVDGPVSGPSTMFVVDIDRHGLADAQLPAGWSLTCA